MGDRGERAPRPSRPHPDAGVGRDPNRRHERPQIARGERREREARVDRPRAHEVDVAVEPAAAAREAQAAHADHPAGVGAHPPGRLDRRAPEPARHEAKRRHLDRAAAPGEVAARVERERGRGEAPRRRGVRERHRDAPLRHLEAGDLDGQRGARISCRRGPCALRDDRADVRSGHGHAPQLEHAAQERERRVDDLEARHVRHGPAAGRDAQVLEHERTAERAPDRPERDARAGRPLEEAHQEIALEAAERAAPPGGHERDRDQDRRHHETREPAPEPPHSVQNACPTLRWI